MGAMDSATYCDQDELRTTFSLAMSAMYKNEVPLYGDLVQIVKEVNRDTAKSEATLIAERLDLERHGAIRLGTPHELRTVRRLFALIGLHPVGYYDLSKAGLPMHATAFRPISQQGLAKNPFRIFTTLLRHELLNPAARDIAFSHLLKRNIFSDQLMTLIGVGEEQGGFSPEQGERFVIEAMRTFQWHAVAATTISDYSELQAEHPILADIACFNTAHINHLTPRTLDIDESEKRMKERGLAVKSNIEGPPARRNPVLLRQTSFLALQEHIKFRSCDSPDLVDGHHRARFGEIEQRGAAVTIRGRNLYDKLLNEVHRKGTECGPEMDSTRFNEILKKTFEQYPDDLRTLVEEGFIFCHFQTTSKAATWNSANANSTARLSDLFREGLLKADPLTYEDFLPLSAAGIFMSNVQGTKSSATGGGFESFEDKEGLERSLGCGIFEPDELYSEAQRASLRICARELGLANIESQY